VGSGGGERIVRTGEMMIERWRDEIEEGENGRIGCISNSSK
jgi:hypothetical protein